ncbi:hypothetical protein BJV77DRAFT_1070785 [Russula vinacea]|nr:hypothetical protein BJV77DRAFT_1070785 [Russula vinacea]
MSGYTNFAVVGAGAIGKYIVQQLLKDKAAGIVKEVVVLARQGSTTTIQGDAKVIHVDYSNHTSIKHALAGVHVVISTVAGEALYVQGKVAAAGKEAGVKLFLKALGMPYALFYTGAFADYFWTSYINIPSGKVSIGGDGNKQVKFTSRPDIARYVSYVLTHLPPEQLKNRAFSITGDNKSFNEIFKAYEEKTGKKIEVTYIPVSELDAKIAANPKDFSVFLLKYWATAGPFQRTDNHLYPDWNPTPAIDYVPVA